MESDVSESRRCYGLTAAEWERVKRCNSSRPIRIQSCIHDLVYETAKSQPDAVALCSWDGSWTYSDFVNIVDRTASWLRYNGVSPGDMVPLYFEKSKWAIVAIFSIMKVGAAWVPLDLSQPFERILEIVKESRSKHVATSKAYAKTFTQEVPLEPLIFDQDHIDSHVWIESETSYAVMPSQVAFVMFTSGSTGKPRGVEIEHSAMVTAISSYAPEFDLGPLSRVLQFTAWIWLPCSVEIFATLIKGGRVCMPSEKDRINNPSEFMRQHAVNFAVFTPSFASSISPSDVPSLKTLGLGGEKISQAILDQWSHSVKVIVCFGSTETNLCILETVVQNRSKGGTAIGTRAWIVDPTDHNRLVPIGVVGELVIESWALAKGYLNDKTQTLKKFLPNSDWIRSPDLKDTAKLCRISDLAMWNPDGTICLLGRADTMAKIRGQRFEPGEVEDRFRQILPPSWQTVVEVVTLQGDETSKVAAFITIEHASPNKGIGPGVLMEAGGPLEEITSSLPRIKAELSKSLPLYMQPSIFIPVHTLPLTSSGKLDRRTLRQLATTLKSGELWRITSHQSPKRPPQSQQECELCELWSSVLNIPTTDIGLDDNFIGLGGDSLSAIKLVSAARKRSIRLTVDAIFKSQNLGELVSDCAHMKQHDDNGLDILVPLSASSTRTSLYREISEQYDISTSAIQDVYPATTLQAGLIALSMKQPGAYVVRSELPLSKDIDVHIFQEAWETVVRLSPILRTRLVQTSEGIMQVALSESVDWVLENDPDTYFARDKQKMTGLGDCLAKYAIIGDLPHGRRFIWTVHHALFDAWSMAQTFRLVEAAYKGADLAPTVKYKAFINYLSTIDHETQASYWRSQLTDASLLKYPALPSSTHQTLTNTAMKQMITFSRPLSSITTVATYMRTAWALLLSQYANTDDVVFGATVSGRGAPVEQIDEMIGPTIATVPIRIRWSPNQSITSLLQDVQSQATGMIPFEQIGMQNVKRLSSEIQHACDFQVLLVIQTSRSETTLQFLGKAAKVEDWQNLSAYALVMEAMLTDEGAYCHVTYDSQVMNNDEIQSLIFQFEHIIRQLCLEKPDALVKDICACSPRDELEIRRFNEKMPETIDSCAHVEFSKQVSAHPDALAIDAWDGRLTYQELDNEATRLAQYLSDSTSIGIEVVIPVVFPKSRFAVISMLAIWRLGGAFALIDAGHPPTWIQQIVRGTATKLVLCSSAIAKSLAPCVTCLEVNAALMKKLPLNHTAIKTSVSSQNLAYVVHTSGSTGQPKGIMHTHSTYVSGVRNRISTMYRNHNARVLQFASYSFDVSIEDIWTTLLVGGVVCIPSDHERSNDLVGYMNRSKTTYAEITPSLARTLQPDDLPYMKIVALSGEASTKTDRDRWLNNVIVLDEYGPAEIAIKSNLKRVEFHSHPSDKGPNVACLGWITQVDNHDRLQAKGAIGELLLEGPIVARGYLRQREKTDEVFIKNPAWLPAKTYGHRRLYKTGDLAVYNSDFSLRILGRKDTQVKLRGQRLELGQIEHQVRQNLTIPALVVADLVFLKVGSKTGTLVIFVSFDDAKRGEMNDEFLSLASDLHTRLSAALPAFMVPSAIIPMSSLPLNMSGKIDRLKLKQAASKLEAEEVLYFSTIEKSSMISPSFTEPARRLRSLWAEILEVDESKISPTDNFLHRGGDSILAMRMVAAATRKKNGVTLTVKDIFLHPRLCDMALVASGPVNVSTSAVIEPYQLLGCTDQEEVHTVRSKVAALCGVDIARIQDIYPCSPLQEALTAISVKNPGYYIAQHIFELHPTIEIERLRRAWAFIIDKITTLRTRIVQLESRLVQAVVEQTIQWQEGQDLKECVSENEASPMLLGDPLVRLAIIRETGSRFLVFSLHHAIYDGWSLPLLLEAVTKLYNDDAVWKPPAEYKSFIHYVSSLNKESHQSYWREQLMDAAECSSNFPRLPHPNYVCKAESTLEHKLRVSIGKLKGFTIPTVLQAAWALLLTKYTENSDTVFGTTVNGRNVPLNSVDEMIGPVFTTIPVRMKLNLHSTIFDYVSQIQNQVIEMIEYQHFGLQNIAQINEDTKAACQFKTLVVMQTPERTLSSQDLFGQRKTQNNYSIFNPFAVMVQFIPTGSTEILINVSFDAKVIDQEQMQRVLFQFQYVVEQLCTVGNDTAIGDILSLSPQDCNEITNWNNGGIPPGSVSSCIHDIFQEQALDHPEAVAVNAWDGTLTYRALDQMSTGLARQLSRFDLRPEDIVPICFEKSLWAVVGVLGALKAGAAFTLLDPSHPVDRLRTIIRETKAKLVLASVKYRQLFHEGAKTVVVVDKAIVRALSTCEDEFYARARPSNLACVVFTSVSTGKPKGILLEHQNLCSSILAHGAALNVSKYSRVFQFASFAFDMAVYDILTTLAFGGCICMPSEHDKLNNLAKAVKDMRANWAFFTPSTVALLHREDVPTLQTLVVGGESVTKDICDEWIGKVRLFQCSGPAETTTCIAGEMDQTSLKNCLGTACGALAWIIDPSNHDVLQPIGVIGELVLEGPTVARGYINKDDDAAGGFTHDPQWSQTLQIGEQLVSRRMYRTGDLVQYDSKGRLLFAGRKDTQIKIRGQRLELAEVESGLRKTLPDHQVAAEVISPKYGTQQRTLAAFVALQDFQRLQGERYGLIATERLNGYRDLLEVSRRSLSNFLPPYMVPSAIIPLNEIPLNSSGKIDRRRLQKIGSCLTQAQLHSSSSMKHQQRPPGTPMEHRLRHLWAEVLRVPDKDIGIDDSFLRLGGDSLSAMRLVAVAHREEIDLTVSNIFKYPILADLALRAKISSSEKIVCQPYELLGPHDIAAAVRKEVSNELNMGADAIVDIYPCTPLQEGLLNLSLQRPGAYVAQEVYKLAPGINQSRLKEACEQVVAMNSILRTRVVQLASSKMMQVVLDEQIQWELEADIRDYFRVCGQDTLLLKAPLTRWAIVEPKSPSLVVTRHHCTYDGHSLPMIMKQIENVYKTSCDLTAVPSVGVGYNNFIRHIINGNAQDHEAYWRNYLLGASQTKFPRSTSASQMLNPSASVSHLLDVKMTNSAITLPNLLRGAWSYCLAQYSSSPDVVFGMTLSGRNSPVYGIENICGPTFTTVPIRINIEDKAISVSRYLERIQNDAIEMIPHEHYGLQNIKRMSHEIRKTCEFENLLVIQPTSDLHLDESIFQAQRIQGSSTFRTYALTMVCQLAVNRIVLTANFDPSMIDEIQVRRLLSHFGMLIDTMTQGSDLLKLSDLDMITKADQDEIWKWNAVVPAVVQTCVHEIIDRQTKFRPYNSAVESWDGMLSYNKLDSVSSKLGYHLVGLGVRMDVKVPILFEKSMWTIVAILGILKAGGAFVPLDPSHPKDRLRAMVTRVEAALVLTSVSHEALGAEIARKTFVVSSDSIHGLADTGACRSGKFIPSSLAYVNFTSGSTGTPKASLIEHSAYCTGAAGHIPRLSIHEFSRVLQFASHGFDTCIEDILTTLMVGGCICIPSETERETDIVGAINRLGVNWVHLTPSFSRSLLPKDMPGVEVIVLGGEAMTEHDVQRWPPRVKLVNAYGPSELCVTCSVNTKISSSKQAANIGFPIGGVTWVTKPDNHDKLAPLGTVGELLVEGPAMARGYMHDETATAAAFVEAPQWLREGSRSVPGRQNRLYKTGDLVRYESDGSLVFVGRKDSQVKLRGQRIELGEIEQDIRGCLAQESIGIVVEMVTPEGDANVSTLVAFLCLDNGRASHGSLIDEQLRPQFKAILDQLREQLPLVLPLYMIPSSYIPLSHIPLTGSKKIDHRKLISLAKSVLADSLRQYSPSHGEGPMPETKLEKQILTIWSQVLNKPSGSIKLNTPFFLVGGDSISAMQVLARCKMANIDITLRELLQRPTIKSICACIMEKGQASDHSTEESIALPVNRNITSSNHTSPVTVGTDESSKNEDGVVNGINGIGINANAIYGNGSNGEYIKSFPLSPIQKRFFELYPEGSDSYQLSHLLEIQRPARAEDIASAIHSIVETHSMLRARFRNCGKNQWEQSLTDEVDESYLFRSQKRANLTDLTPGFTRYKSLISVENGPCLIACLVTAPHKQVLFISIHHLVTDLISFRIILQDLEQLLQTPSQPPSPPSTTYPAWCLSQQHQVRKTTDLAAILPFKLRPNDLDFWNPHLPRIEYKTSTLTLRKDVSESIMSPAFTDKTMVSVKPLDVLLGALIHSFALTFPERATPAIFNSSHGRHPISLHDALDVSRTVGWFTSFYPVQVDIQPSQHQQVEGANVVAATVHKVAALHHQYGEDLSSFFINQYLLPDSAGADSSPAEGYKETVEVAFNYQGRHQQLEREEGLFQRVELEGVGLEEQDGEVRHGAVLEVVMGWRDGRGKGEGGEGGRHLEAVFAFHPDIWHRGRVEEWVGMYGECLREAVGGGG